MYIGTVWYVLCLRDPGNEYYFCQLALEDTGSGGKGGEGGGNEGVPKMVLRDSIFSCDCR